MLDTESKREMMVDLLEKAREDTEYIIKARNSKFKVAIRKLFGQGHGTEDRMLENSIRYIDSMLFRYKREDHHMSNTIITKDLEMLKINTMLLMGVMPTSTVLDSIMDNICNLKRAFEA